MFKGDADAPNQLEWPCQGPRREAGRIPVTHKEPLHATPQALARDLARTFPQVEVVPCGTGHAVLVDGCPYLTNSRVSLQRMPTG